MWEKSVITDFFMIPANYLDNNIHKYKVLEETTLFNFV